MYRKMFESHIRYENVVGFLCRCFVKKKLKFQNSAEHIVARSGYDLDAEPLIKEL